MKILDKINQLRQRVFNKRNDEATPVESYGLREELDELIRELNEFKNAGGLNYKQAAGIAQRAISVYIFATGYSTVAESPIGNIAELTLGNMFPIDLGMKPEALLVRGADMCLEYAVELHTLAEREYTTVIECERMVATAAAMLALRAQALASMVACLCALNTFSGRMGASEENTNQDSK
jgi:hypothetical protein